MSDKAQKPCPSGRGAVTSQQSDTPQSFQIGVTPPGIMLRQVWTPMATVSAISGGVSGRGSGGPWRRRRWSG
jgi:hypothetical protein